MGNRYRAVAAGMLVAGCHPSPGGNAAADIDRDGIACARGEAPFVKTCTVERTATDRGPVLTLRRDDGSFRRLLVTQDGRGVIAADGAEPARVIPVGTDRIEVRIGNDRYELPATIKAAR